LTTIALFYLVERRTSNLLLKVIIITVIFTGFFFDVTIVNSQDNKLQETNKSLVGRGCCFIPQPYFHSCIF